jgi:hypothetical protein
MGCGCKNKGNQEQQPTTQQGQQPSQPEGQKTNNQSIQESIKKVVEKYYTKR